MPDDRWRALGLGSAPAPGPRVPTWSEEDQAGFLDRLGSLVSGGQPSLASRMQELSQMQRARLPDGTAPGPPQPGSPEAQLAMDVAGNFDFLGPIKAYHGSPHTFDAFSLGKIGTGEGAQVYGHGLYFAEKPEVAKDYAQKLGGVAEMTSGGKPIRARNQAEGYAKSLLSSHVRDGFQDPITETAKMLETASYLNSRQKKVAANALERWRSGGFETKAAGSTYTVNLAVEPEDLLDWDLPLSQQPEKVRQALEGLGWDKLEQQSIDEGWTSASKLGEQTLGDLYGQARYALQPTYTSADAWQGTAADVSAQLRAAGIPGLRYLDQGSRAGGEGSRNIVLFDDALAEILERNGVPVTRK